MIRRTEWKDHISIRDNIEIVKILEIIYGLLCNLELLLIPGQYVMDLVMIKNRLHTTIFLLCASIVILFYETAVPLALVAAALKMLHNLYEHERFTPLQPDVKYNIDFIKNLSEFIMAAKYNTDMFTVDVIYWREPKNSSKLVGGLLIAAVLTFIVLHLISLRVIILIGVWLPVLYHS